MTETDIQTRLDADGLLIATIDMPGRAMNVFSRALMDALEALMTLVAGDPAIKAVVLTSGKPSFLAGADLEMIKMFAERAETGTTEELRELFGHLGRLFRRLELHAKPFVAAVNGLALGGGLELAMACHARVVADDPAIQLGLPEVKLGLLPGAGGTQRLPRLVGISAGLRMLLTGEPVAPAEALALHLADALVPPAQLLDAARQKALALANAQPPHRADWDRHGARYESTPFNLAGSSVHAEVAKAIGLSDEQMRHYPAHRAIIDCVAGGWNRPMTEASEHEMGIFVQLMRDPAAGNMVRSLFLDRQKAAKQGLLKPDSPLARTLLPALKAARERALGLGGGDDEVLLAVSLAALREWLAGGIEAPALADAAAVAANLFPAYAGGPYRYAQQRGEKKLRALGASAAMKDAELFAVPAGLERFFSPGAAIAA